MKREHLVWFAIGVVAYYLFTHYAAGRIGLGGSPPPHKAAGRGQQQGG